jgi:cell division protein FtsI (penicillin-binding protein 3)
MPKSQTVATTNAVTAGRVRFVMIATALVASLLLGRLVVLQVINGPRLAAMAEQERRTLRDIPAVRGAITDINGHALAVSVKAVDVVADQKLVINPEKTAATLAPLLGLPQAQLQITLTGDRRFVYVKRTVDPVVWQKILKLRVSGVFAYKASKRVYPGKTLASNILGFVGVDGVGLAGVELMAQKDLAGVNGVARYERDPAGRAIPDTQSQSVPPIPGSDIRLTIDRDIQWTAESELAAAVAKAKADYGTVVVMRPATGEILAQATVPSMDSNNARAADPTLRGNRAVSDVYEPGSTSKMMTMAAVLDSGKATAVSKFTVPYSMKFGTRVLHDHDKHGPERMTLNGILANSSNIGTYLAARLIGERRLYDTLKRFGIAQRTGLGFPGESRGALPDPSTWSITSFPTIAYGQGLSVNAIQAASAYATIANDGVRMQPRLVAGTVGANGAYTATPTPPGVRVVSSSTARTLRQMLESVVDKGTGTNAAVRGYRVAGKTGTASRFDAKLGKYSGYVASFIGMLPADKPALVIAVSIHNPRGAHYGGAIAAPVFAKIATFAVQEQRIAPSTTPAANLPLRW